MLRLVCVTTCLLSKPGSLPRHAYGMECDLLSWLLLKLFMILTSVCGWLQTLMKLTGLASLPMQPCLCPLCLGIMPVRASALRVHAFSTQCQVHFVDFYALSQLARLTFAS